MLWPETWMNRSGDAVGAAASFFRASPAQVTVFHDEIELPLGRVRVKTGGGSAGHNGLRDIERAIGRNFRRVRLGVGRPPGLKGREMPVDRHVLSDFLPDERVIADSLADAVADAWRCLALSDQESRFMTAVALRMADVLAVDSGSAANGH